MEQTSSEFFIAGRNPKRGQTMPGTNRIANLDVGCIVRPDHNHNARYQILFIDGDWMLAISLKKQANQLHLASHWFANDANLFEIVTA